MSSNIFDDHLKKLTERGDRLLNSVEVKPHCVICGAEEKLELEKGDGKLYCESTTECIKRRVEQIVSINKELGND